MKSYRSFPSRSSLEACLFVQHYVRRSSLGATHGTFLSASFQDQVETQRTSDSNVFFRHVVAIETFAPRLCICIASHVYGIVCWRKHYARKLRKQTVNHA